MSGYGDTGGASRFFYIAKASRAERNAGLDGMPERHAPKMAGGEFINPLIGSNNKTVMRQNHHPTVKPIALMRYLCRLITPPGGTILDPFMGSGTTGCAAALEGFDFIGIEQDGHYADIARRRIAYWAGPLLMEVVA
jgi:site-specific DNA-methyltransferase (adenine-specific)